ncbi:hypothetical protein AXF42_Ash012523 [Apostasia shenzhenica]|uniref:Pentatricopeptide repeat-containing protein n=1 Tax=Apostasia shenzhenica TaxID=1088818 RepID=A0A2I0AR07_9ASPA|nr:hypothetical protein AXF42_Ash012523 [Apostasia shenzhenica]
MDLSFSAKPQTLIASVSFHNFHLPSLSRREFLGCGGQLKVTGLRSRKAHGKLGFQILSPRCLVFHESVYEYSVIAIAATVAAFTAMDMVCLSRDRREGSANETEKHFLVGEALRMKHSVSEREDIVSRAPEMVPSTKDHVLVIRDETTLEEPKEPLVSAERELMDNGNISFGQSDSSLGIPVIPVPNCSVNSAKEKLREVGENNYEGIQKHLADESELLVSNCTEDHHGSAKETSNTDKEQLEVESISCFGSLNRKPLNLRPKDSDYGNLSFSLNRVEIMKKGFSRSSVKLDFPDGQVPLMSFNKSFKSKKNCCSVDIGRDAKARKENRDLSTFLHPNGGLLKISSNVLTCLRTYDCLLRDARLKDCLDLLESMESKGLLDMDKVASNFSSF